MNEERISGWFLANAWPTAVAYRFKINDDHLIVEFTSADNKWTPLGTFVLGRAKDATNFAMAVTVWAEKLVDPIKGK